MSESWWRIWLRNLIAGAADVAMGIPGRVVVYYTPSPEKAAPTEGGKLYVGNAGDDTCRPEGAVFLGPLDAWRGRDRVLFQLETYTARIPILPLERGER